MIDELSVFLPAYNEEGNIRKVSLSVISVLKKIALKWELIIVDDGSADRTGEIADQLAAKDKHIKVVHHQPNQGYGGALKSGYQKAAYSWVAFMDSDGQFDFSEISKFIEIQKKTDADIVCGIREHRADSLLRQLFTFVWSKLLPRLIFNLQVTDYSCGFKLIRKEVYRKVLPLIGEEKVTQIEMLVKAQRLGCKFAEVRVGHYPRQAGRQTGADFKVIAKSVYDLLKLWSQLR
jgi:glycosyltransferase involved in cell wall biosynthesis